MMQEWVIAAKAGESTAWNVLYQQHYPALMAQALRICSNTPTAKDAVQDAFVTAYLKLEQLKDPAAFSGWIKTILVHTCYRMQQKHKKHDINSMADSWWDDEINRKMDHISNRNRLHATISALPETLRSTLMLRYFTDVRSYDDIAKVLSVPVGTVRSRMNQAKLKLSEQWQHNNDAGLHVFKKGEEWNQFYGDTFGRMHRHDDARDRLLSHMKKDMELTFTSGKTCAGRDLIVKELEDDRRYGSWFEPVNIVSSGNMSIVEAKNYNSAEHPHRCPPTAVFVLYREKEKTARLNFHLQ